MGTGWRRAFCNSVRRDSETPLGGVGAGGGGKLQCKTTTAAAADPGIDAGTPVKSARSVHSFSLSASSPKSPSRFALFKAALRLSRSRCGICAESVRRNGGERTAVFTSECSHSFHFPCISAHVRSNGRLICPVCSATWQEVPLLSSSLSSSSPSTPSSAKSAPQPTTPTSSSAHSTFKIYNDDESLIQLSPSKGGAGMTQFNPIPEESETEDDDVDNTKFGPEIVVTLVPESAVLVSTARTHLSYVVSIRIKSPQFPPQSQSQSQSKPVSPLVPASLLDHPSCRAPIDLVTVLDVSGSMTAAKLQMLKKAMRLVVSSLGPGDRLSIVAFSAIAAKRLLPLRRMSRPGQRSARQIVERLVICGTHQIPAEGQSSHCSSKSCVGDALRKATKVLEDRRERNPVATIMLLSDSHGQQNQPSNVRNATQQSMAGTRFTHLEIPINGSSEGFGGQKQRSGVNGLVSVVLQDVQLQLALPSSYGGVISSVYSFSGGFSTGIGRAMSHGEGGRSVVIGDMYADEERQLLVEIKVPKTTFIGNGENAMPMNLSVGCSYRDPVTRDVIHGSEQSLMVPMPLLTQNPNPTLRRTSSSCPSTSSTVSTNSGVALRSVFVTTRAMAESTRLVELGDLDTAIHLLSSARSLLLQQATSTSNSNKKLVIGLETEIEDLQRQQKRQQISPSYRRRGEQALLAECRVGGGGGGGGGREEALTPTSAWRAAEQLAKVAIMRKSINRVSDLHGLENARF